MVRPQALMESVPADLHEFLQAIDTELTRPQKKFLRDGLVGLLWALRPVVCRMARKLPAEAQSLSGVSLSGTVTKPLGLLKRNAELALP